MNAVLNLVLIWMASVVWSTTIAPTGYTPVWSSLDTRPLPLWYDQAKIGIFIHWGIYSVPSYTSEWFWNNWKGNVTPNGNRDKILKYMKGNFKPQFSYQDFARDFTAEFFNASLWAEIFEQSGARYVVLTSKHHEGYTLWPSKYSFSWNSKDVGPHHDLIGELETAVRKKSSLKFGLYHSLYEWFNPLWQMDKASNFTIRSFVHSKVMPELKELVLKYNPEVIWSDGEWEAPSDYWESKEFLAWLYNDSPVKNKVVVNDRWGHETLCKHGGVYTCADRYNPGTLQQHKWENAMTIDKHSWGFNRVSNLNDYLTSQELIDTLVQTVACGGNLLMNVGPAKDGTIPAIFQDRLSEVGKWLKINGEAIYKSQPWDNCQNDTVTPNIWYTSKGKTLYIVMLRWPKTGVLSVSCPSVTNSSTAVMLGVPGKELKLTTKEKSMLEIQLPDKSWVDSDWAWVIKLTAASYL